MFYEKLVDPVIFSVDIQDGPINFIVEPPMNGFAHSCTVEDIVSLLNLASPGDLDGLKNIELRQPKRKERILSPPELNRSLIHELAAGRYIHDHAPILIVGPSGTGKSHLAQALGQCAIRQGIDTLFTSCAQLTASLNAARANGAYERKLTTLARVSLLIIDDIGLKPLRPPADEDLQPHRRALRDGRHYRD